MGELLSAYDATVKANAQLVDDLDGALVEAGRTIAARVDEATESGEGQEVTKALYLVPHLMNVLREMHATPSSRLLAGVDNAAKNPGRLAQLRSVTASKVGQSSA